MPLFGKVDSKNLLWLTRFYQVLPPAEQFPDFDIESFDKTELYAFLVAATPGRDMFPKPGEKEYFMRFHELHGLIRILLPALADNGNVTKRFLKKLRDFMDRESRTSSYFEYFVISPEHKPTEPHSYIDFSTLSEGELDEVVHAKRVNFMANFTGSLDHVMPNMINELNELMIYHRWPVVRCVECGSPFPSRRSDSEHCSHRCADRTGGRRRYESKRIATSRAVRNA